VISVRPTEWGRSDAEERSGIASMSPVAMTRPRIGSEEWQPGEAGICPRFVQIFASIFALHGGAPRCPRRDIVADSLRTHLHGLLVLKGVPAIVLRGAFPRSPRRPDAVPFNPHRCGPALAELIAEDARRPVTSGT